MQHTEHWFKTRDGLKLYAQRWAPDQDAQALVMLLHGFAEHSGRYGHVAAHLAEHGFALEAFDQRGHGRSEGRRANVNHFGDYVQDARQFAAQVRDRAEGRPVFLLGHSMGGTISTLLACADQSPWQGLILSSAGLQLGQDISPLLQRLSGVLGAVAPGLPTVKIDSKVISRDSAVVQRYDQDPLNYRQGAPARWAAEFTRGIQQARQQMDCLTLPLLILCGGNDQLIDPAGSRALHAAACSEDKTLLCYEPCYHELLNEPEQVQVLSDIVDWLEARL